MTKQRTLFDDWESDGRPDWEREDTEPLTLVRVVFPDGPDGFFDYRIPDSLLDRIEPGMRLMVPLGKSNRSVLVYAVEVKKYEESDLPDGCRRDRIKDVLQIVDTERLLSSKMLELARWLGETCLCPLGQVLEAVLPAGVRDHAGTRLTTVFLVAEDADAKLAKLAAIKNKTPGEVLTPKQRIVFDILRGAGQPMTSGELSRAAKCSMVPINSLKSLGLFRKTTIRRKSLVFDELTKPVTRTQPLVLNVEQKESLERILDALRKGEFHPFLLHGVTGSGKTEVYIQAIEEVVSYGKQAIVLVPEISLTPQTVDRFRQRFDSIAVLHSHLTDAERHVEWTRIASGKVQVVIGARSAVFAPVPHCGLIVIDEEHESTFKQDTAPRYHAREVALYRGRQEKIPVVFGSATPSLESWHRQRTGEFELLSIFHRVLDLPLPHVSIVDLRSRTASGFTRGAIHQQLHQAIQEELRSKGQIILLLNRRGFSTQIQCPACGEVLKCPNCDVSLTHHYIEQSALCHYCDYQVPVPNNCPKCGYSGIRFSGFGTQKLEQELSSRFPGVLTLRMDADTMQAHGAHERALTAFRNGEYQILLGTQMIAKGLDFPNVTLVGVINADTALHLPDFRAAERTFHLITQVAGRTGRSSRSGRVIVQTYNPDHPAIVAASRHDYASFVEQELAERKLRGYPPFSFMVRIVLRGPDEKDVLTFARQMTDALRQILEQEAISLSNEKTFQYRLLGPAPAPFTKLRGNFRYHIHLHGNDRDRLRKAVKKFCDQKMKAPNDVQWIVDIDPLDML